MTTLYDIVHETVRPSGIGTDQKDLHLEVPLEEAMKIARQLAEELGMEEVQWTQPSGFYAAPSWVINVGTPQYAAIRLNPCDLAM